MASHVYTQAYTVDRMYTEPRLAQNPTCAGSSERNYGVKSGSVCTRQNEPVDCNCDRVTAGRTPRCQLPTDTHILATPHA
jgi:hypothetical protein